VTTNMYGSMGMQAAPHKQRIALGMHQRPWVPRPPSPSH